MVFLLFYRIFIADFFTIGKGIQKIGWDYGLDIDSPGHGD
jgi:hypothetical protein